MTNVIDLSVQSAEVGGSPGLKGHLARPHQPGPWPGVVVVHKVHRADEVMSRQADRLAQASYLTLMPDL